MFLNKETDITNNEKRIILPKKYENEISFLKLTFTSDLSYKNNYIVSINNKYTSPIKKQLNERFIICAIDGITIVKLFSPIEEKNLYPDYSNYNKLNYLKSKVNFNEINNTDNNLYPKFKDVKYIEVILNPGNCLYIPTHWWYNYSNKTENDNIHLEIYSDTYFTELIKIPRYVNYLVSTSV